MNNKIYCIENTENGMQYVGKTKLDVDDRFKIHINNSKSKSVNKTYLYSSFVNYGVDKFIVFLLEDNISNDEINQKEIFWISELNTFAPNGYNLTKGGDGGDTSKSINFINSMKKYHNNKSYESYATNGFKGKTHSDESKLKQANARHKYWNNPKNRLNRKDTSGANNPSSKPIIINSVEYVSLAAASRELDVSETYLRNQVKKCGSRNLKLSFSFKLVV